MAEKYKIPKAPDVQFDQLREEARKAATQGDAGHADMTEMERSELNALIGQGATYTLRYVKSRGILGRRKKPVVETHTIKQPTLAILDEISRIAIDLTIDEEGIAEGGLATIKTARSAVRDNALRNAQIIALATLGEEYYEIREVAGRIERKKDRKALQRLTSLIYNTATPAQLSQMAASVTNMSNLGDFINSTRLLSARTTQPRAALVESKG